MSFFHKKRASTKANAANVHMTEAEAALAQSDFNIDKILDIQNKFTGGTGLLVPGRIFIREGMLWKVCRKGPKKRQFFLFNDILVYGSVVAGRYSNQHVLPLAHMTVSGDPSYQPQTNTTFNIDALDEQLDVHNAFQISHANKSFHVFSLSQADKANWLANLQKHINKVALVGDNQPITPRAVWVPDSHSKECMVCGQKFTAFNRKHHCRQCGRVVCSTCSPHRVIIDRQTENKPERVCSECVNDVSPVRSKGSPDLNAKPPPATVAAQVVSNVLRHNSDRRSPGHSPQSPRRRRDSTDTEDSDDSEEDTPPSQKKPTPTPRRTLSDSAKHAAATGSPFTGPPQRPPPFSLSRPPTNLDTPTAPQRPPPYSSSQPATKSDTPTVKKEMPKPKPRTRKLEPEPATVAGENREEGGSGEVVTVGERGGVGSVAVASDEPQPTPPPRKRRKAKLKQQLEQQLQQQFHLKDQPVGEGRGEGEQTEGDGQGERKGRDGEVERRGEGVVEGDTEEEKRGSVPREAEGEGEAEEEKRGSAPREAEGKREAEEEKRGTAPREAEGEGEAVEEKRGREGEGEGEERMAGELQEVEEIEIEVQEVGKVEELDTVEAVDQQEEAEEGREGGEVEVCEVAEAVMSMVLCEEEVETPESVGIVTSVHSDSVSPEPCEGSEEGTEKGVPKRPRRRKKHFRGQDSDGCRDDESDPRETTPTDSTHHQSKSLADQETISKQEDDAPACTETDQSETPNLAENEASTEQQSPGQSSEPVEEDAPVKKPRGRRPKFKPAES